MSYILHIESSTKVCSVALSRDGKLLACREEDSVSYSHSGMLTIFVEDVMREANLPLNALAAIAISKGPGSYTGLRIGVSAAKGLCYGLDIPLIGISTLQALAVHCRDILGQSDKYISPEALEAIYCPMIDARRMEVYTGLFNHQIQPIQDIQALVVDQNSFSDILDKHKLLFFGDGAEKCRNILTRNNAIYIDGIRPSARAMIPLATEKFHKSDIEDVAYFEPFYLKDFVAGIPKVKGLLRDF
jgi:tRNA threonylcarbamoyladenosine biosynthesis protein TsaB